MSAEVSAEPFDSTAPPAAAHLPGAFAARGRLLRLRDALAGAARATRPARWGEPPVFFFDRRRQAELAGARPATSSPLAELGVLVSAELPGLVASVEARRVARAVGLREAARELAARCPAAKELAELLTVPDDEVFLALAPAARAGVRLHLRGAAEVWQLRELLAVHLGGDHQLFLPAALRPDGTLPAGFCGAAHWLWPGQPLAAIPRINGERVVLVGPAVVRARREAEPRFPGLAVECELVEALNPFQAARELSRLCGRPVHVHAPAEAAPVARAA